MLNSSELTGPIAGLWFASETRQRSGDAQVCNSCTATTGRRATCERVSIWIFCIITDTETRTGPVLPSSRVVVGGTCVLVHVAHSSSSPNRCCWMAVMASSRLAYGGVELESGVGETAICIAPILLGLNCRFKYASTKSAVLGVLLNIRPVSVSSKLFDSVYRCRLNGSNELWWVVKPRVGGRERAGRKVKTTSDRA